MTDKELFLASLTPVKDFILSDDTMLQEAIEKAYAGNQWFTPEFTRNALYAIAHRFLDEENVDKWIDLYNPGNTSVKNIAIIMAGNVPLVGFHDLMCVLSSGHNAIIKLSDKDSILSRFIIDRWKDYYPAIADRISFSEKLEGYDAVIATGSNNSSRYFEYYFRDKPHILRKNRNGVALLTGQESVDELKNLARDIFLYFGLGCRNVSKMYVPLGYDFSLWHRAIEDWSHLSDHNKFRNNLDYNFAIFIMNQIPHIHLGHLILKEDNAISSRIGSVHYEYYEDGDELMHELENRRIEIQCLVSSAPVGKWDHVGFGNSQTPSLTDYADGVDTMQFLASLN